MNGIPSKKTDPTSSAVAHDQAFKASTLHPASSEALCLASVTPSALAIAAECAWITGTGRIASSLARSSAIAVLTGGM